MRTVMGKAIFLKRRTVIASKVALSATTHNLEVSVRQKEIVILLNSVSWMK